MWIPRISEIKKTIADLQNNLGNCYHAYLYSDSEKPVRTPDYKYVDP
jgi:hypothetical protein